MIQMTRQLTPEDVLLDEFSTYYQADELPLFIETGLSEWVDDSAARIVNFHADVAPQAADLLRNMASDPAHPLLETIAAQTTFGWNGDPHSWEVFQKLALRMADAITVAVGG
jgi:hypothetical protein